KDWFDGMRGDGDVWALRDQVPPHKWMKPKKRIQNYLYECWTDKDQKTAVPTNGICEAPYVKQTFHENFDAVVAVHPSFDVKKYPDGSVYAHNWCESADHIQATLALPLG